MEAVKNNANKMQLSLDTCLIILLCYLIKGLDGLRMIKVSIPAYKLRGESAFLECQYELSSHKNGHVYTSAKQEDTERSNFDMNYSDADELPSTYARTRTQSHSYPYQSRQQQQQQQQVQQQRPQQHEQYQRQQSRKFKRSGNGNNALYQYQQHYQQQQEQLEQQQEEVPQQEQEQEQEEQYQYERPYQTQKSPYGHSIYRGRSQTYSMNFGTRPGLRTHHTNGNEGIDSREHGESFTDSAESSRQRLEHETEEEEEEGEALYAIKWYKDNEEFYRYVPKANPPKTSYRVDGVRVFEEHSDSSRVLLRGLTLNSTGLYRCEISAEAPNFSSVQGEGRMDIVFLPRDGPHIKGQQYQYQIGETLNFNCTSGKSHPASHLQWFINDQPVSDKRYLVQYNDTVHKHGLITSMLGLQLIVDSRHFRNGAMRVKCLASISPVLWKGGKESVLQRRPGIIDNREAMLLVRSLSRSIHERNFQCIYLLVTIAVVLINICQLKTNLGLI